MDPPDTPKDDKQTILDAAKSGDLHTIQAYYRYSNSNDNDNDNGNDKNKSNNPRKIPLQFIKDSSGCTILHWACGNNHLPLVQYLLDNETEKNKDNDGTPKPTRTGTGTGIGIGIFHVDDFVTSRKAKGRTGLHYAARNGHLDIVKVLVEVYGANIHARAKHGVTPFQLAIWQNRLDVCKYLVNGNGNGNDGNNGNGINRIVPKLEVNDFGCGIIHWMGIMPLKRSEGIVTLAKWIFSQDGIDIRMKQSQGRTVLHKASWGGHLDLVKYLHEVHEMYDDTKDHAGNYAADLCDMANTKNHDAISLYLRKECSLEYKESCEILGLDRKVLLPLPLPLSSMNDNNHYNDDNSNDHGNKSSVGTDKYKNMVRSAYLSKAKECHPDKRGDNDDFQSIKKAYEHLMNGGAAVQQKNPMHSIHLMLEVQKNRNIMKDIGNDNSTHPCSVNVNMEDEMKLFKPRLISVLLEYGEKGISLSNIPKVWDKVWPQNPFPQSTSTCSKETKNGNGTGNGKSKRKRKKGELLRLLQDHAEDVIDVIRQEDKGILIVPKNISHRDVTQFVSEQVQNLEIT